ncbi:MAG: kelch repeat-containing protein, partial [Dokdonella sp.]
VASDGQYAYIIGGADIINGSTAAGYRYDPGANTYLSIAASPTATWSSAAVYLDGKIYKIGGFSTDTTASNAVEVYNIAGNNWTTVAPYPIAGGFISAFVRDHFIYAAGGADSLLQGTFKAYRYDPANNVWDDSALADLPQSRWGAASASFNGAGLIAGGFVNGSSIAKISATALQWNAQTNTWTALPDMLLARARFGGVVRGCFFAIGGISATGTVVNFVGTSENQEFDWLFYDGFGS